MKFKVKNDFYMIINGRRTKKTKGEIIDVPEGKIDEFKKMNIIGVPVKFEIEAAIVQPEENEVVEKSKRTRKTKKIEKVKDES